MWFANQLLPANSFAMLKAAQQLRKSGRLAPGNLTDIAFSVFVVCDSTSKEVQCFITANKLAA